MVVARPSKRKSTLPNLSARLLVLGGRQVGKSAAIVRFTTGRFIQQYGAATDDWLHRTALADSRPPLASSSDESALADQDTPTAVELLEQSDVRFCSTSNIFASSAPLSNQDGGETLASRVALDQQIDNELHVKQQLMSKLHWAHAYVVVYAIDDVATFNKAIKYLNLIANSINSPADKRSVGEHHISGASPSLAAAKLSASRLSPSFGQHQPKVRRPILLLGNKKDLESSARQVSAGDARLLAMRHQSMFAEVSVAESAKLVEGAFVSLVDQIDSSQLHVDAQTPNQLLNGRPTIVRWRPGLDWAPNPILGNFVKTKPIKSVVHSKQLATVSKVKSDVRLITPISATPLTLRRESAKTRPPSEEPLNKSSEPERTVQHQPSRYQSLKSSFKRASMAIVSSKALARGSKVSKAASESKRSSIDEEGTSVNLDSRHTSVSDTLSVASSSTIDSQPHPTQKRRPLFRYRNRRKSIAFGHAAPSADTCAQVITVGRNQPVISAQTINIATSQPVAGCTTSSVAGAPSAVLKSSSTSSNTSARAHQSRRSGSGRSSSSLSTSDTYYTLPTTVCDTDRAPSSSSSASVASSNYSSSNMGLGQFKPTIRKNSKSTLSPVSTSAGSYEESCDEAHQPLARLDRNPVKIQLATTKHGHHLVRSVHSTLASFTRSSSASAQAAKKSFCNTLSKISNSTHNGSVTGKTLDPTIA